jgi:hypothetical protein
MQIAEAVQVRRCNVTKQDPARQHRRPIAYGALVGGFTHWGG